MDPERPTPEQQRRAGQFGAAGFQVCSRRGQQRSWRWTFWDCESCRVVSVGRRRRELSPSAFGAERIFHWAPRSARSWGLARDWRRGIKPHLAWIASELTPRPATLSLLLLHQKWRDLRQGLRAAWGAQVRFSGPSAAQGVVHRRRTPWTLQAFPRPARSDPTSRYPVPLGSWQRTLSTGTSLKIWHWRQFQPDSVGHSSSRDLARNSDLDPTLRSPRDDPSTSRILKETTAAKGEPIDTCSDLALLHAPVYRMCHQRRQLRRTLLFFRNGIASRRKICSNLDETAPAANPPHSKQPASAKREVPGASYHQPRDPPCKIDWLIICSDLRKYFNVFSLQP